MPPVNDDIFSVRLVIADFYMEKPILGLDPCYSEFRGKEIKRVPIIRIFGANSNGRKTCMHIHGVFPYFYIPYEQKEFETPGKAFYQIATSVDKAINISLGQSNSTAQHVFKVQLVKGIPFYGYHRTEHQLLKIYMFNPRFVRRAANLLQGGAVLNKSFHPFESHVPYILQFMIDYNLYGMSFLHVPLEVVKFRQSATDNDAENNVEQFASLGIKPAQLLSTSIASKRSNSSIEVDVGSHFILNRFQLVAKSNSSLHANPGIEAIWHDERVRRQKLSAEIADDLTKLSMIPPLEVPVSQERLGVHSTESEIFHRTALITKLLMLENSGSGSGTGGGITPNQTADQTLNSTIQPIATNMPLDLKNSREQRRTFNLRKLMVNAIYPEECTPNENFENASFIQNHLSNNTLFLSGSSARDASPAMHEAINSPLPADDVFLDDTIVDENLVMGLMSQTQKPLNYELREEDKALLDVLQHLEEGNENENHIDLDSTLAPLSQSLENANIAPEILDQNTLAVTANQPICDSDGETEANDEHNLQDFSMVLEDFDELILKFTPSQSCDPNSGKQVLPQLDGLDDILHTPKKTRNTNKKIKVGNTSPPKSPKNTRSPQRSPRTPSRSAASKYAPLPIKITNRFAENTNTAQEKTPVSHRDALHGKPDASSPQSSKITLSKKLAIVKLRRISMPNMSCTKVSGTFEIAAENKNTPKRCVKNAANLDKTHITCALTPRRKSERLLKVYNLTPKGSSNEQFKERVTKKGTEGDAKTNVRKKKVKAATLINENKDIKACNVSQSVPSNERSEVKITQKNAESDIKQNLYKETVQALTLDNENMDIKVYSVTQNRPSNERSEVKISQKKKEAKRNECEKKVKASTLVKEIQDIKVYNTNQNVPSNERSEVNVTQKESDVQSVTLHNENMDIMVYNVTESRCSNERSAGKATGKDVKSEGRQSLYKKTDQAVTTDNENKKIFDIPRVDATLNLERDESRTSSTLEDSIKLINEKLARKSEECDEIYASDTEEAERSINCKRMRRSIHLAKRLKKQRKQAASPINVVNTSEVAKIADYENSPKASTQDQVDVEDQSEENDWMIQSFYDTSFFGLSSPPLFGSDSPINNKEKVQEVRSQQWSAQNTPTSKLAKPESTCAAHSDSDKVIQLVPLLAPPTYQETLQVCQKLDIHEYEFQQPFYGNPDDITKQKEVGHIVLQIPGHTLNDRPEFQSVLGVQLKGLTQWRHEKFNEMHCSTSKVARPNAQRLREYFAKQKHISITPYQKPPSRYEAKLWLKARELLSDDDKTRTPQKIGAIGEDTPIKVKRQKVSMILNEGIDGKCADDEDMDCSSCSLSLTPLTPAYAKTKETNNATDNTPLKGSTVDKTDSAATCESIKKQRRRTKKSKLSLNARLKAAMDIDKHCKEKLSQDAMNAMSSLTDNKSKPLKISGESVQSALSNDSSVSSEAVLAQLKRSSFVKQLSSAKKENSFGLTDATLDNTFGFKVDLENLQDAKADIECNYLTTMVLDLFVPTRGNLLPNPEFDEIHCIFYAIENSIPVQPPLTASNESALPQNTYGYIIVTTENDIVREGKIHGIDVAVDVKVVNSEIEAFGALVELCLHWDPDIYAGYEIEMASWGYIIDRAKALCINIAPMLSRVPTEKVREVVDEDREHFTDIDVEMKLCGRILLDVWRLMRHEIALTSYTYENVMYHILHKRTPLHNFRQLTDWFAKPYSRWIVIEYYLERVHGTLALLAQLDLIGRTSEMAKLIGIQFYEVLSRGSQFRVESMMLRIAKPKNIVPLSPSVQQRAHMRAPEYLPLILEPQSRFYADPVIVLDFQSLYPSMIIAYNYCFSTCLGRVEHLGHSAPFEFGASQLRVPPTLLRKLIDQDLINIAPGGVVFVKSNVREGILPRMLVEILDTRQMVKQSMKLHKSNSALQRVLHSRQLGLKLMANVTYGYTAANFSGRMPAVEVGDSVVAKGRETLERAIKLVEANEKWRVKVVYGDTDSMFVLVPGRNRSEAFKIGEEIAEAVSKSNPQPVKLKLEKVYQPCILQTKKRYVGYMYETADQTEPIYEAKGIETVRRDGCPAVAKMLEKVLRILFETADVSQIKQYVCRQFTKLLAVRANIQDLIFAKEFRGLNGYKPTACVPALELTRKWIKSDPRRIPRCGERVPFVIVNGPPGLPLIRLVRGPHEVLTDESLKINALYYITKAIIPPLNRCLLLIGADVNEWFANLPRKLLLTAPTSTANELVPCKDLQQSKKSTISQYFSITNCVVDCGRQTKEGICERCAKDKQKTFLVLHAKIAKIERSYQLVQQICQACCGRLAELKCSSLNCPVLYVSEVKRRDLKQITHFQKLLAERF